MRQSIHPNVNKNKKIKMKMKCPHCLKEFEPKAIAELYVCPLCGCWMPRYE